MVDINIKQLRSITSYSLVELLKDGEVNVVSDGEVIAKLRSGTDCTSKHEVAHRDFVRPYSKSQQVGK